MTNEFGNIIYILEKEEGKNPHKKKNKPYFSWIDTIANIVILKLLGLTL